MSSGYANDERVTLEDRGSYLVDTTAGPFRVRHAGAGAVEAFPVGSENNVLVVLGTKDDAIRRLIGDPQ